MSLGHRIETPLHRHDDAEHNGEFIFHQHDIWAIPQKETFEGHEHWVDNFAHYGPPVDVSLPNPGGRPDHPVEDCPGCAYDHVGPSCQGCAW